MVIWGQEKQMSQGDLHSQDEGKNRWRVKTMMKTPNTQGAQETAL